MERSDQLRPGGLRIYYDDALFPPGTDSFLLSAFPRLKGGLRVCDLGSGTGLLGTLLLQRQDDLTVTGIELLPQAADLARRGAEANGIADRLTTITGDLRDVRQLLPAGSFDLVIANPPYYPLASGALSPDDARRAARAETACTLADIFRAAAWLLRWGGSFCLVHKPERLTDLLCAARDAGLEPKRLRLVSPAADRSPSLVLLECRRGGKPGLEFQPPLILYTPDGHPTLELDAIYFRTTEDTP